MWYSKYTIDSENYGGNDMRYLNELTTTELKNVYENNKGIREKAFNLYADNVWNWVDEYISVFDRRNVEICFDSYNYPIIHIYNTYEFIDGLKEMQRMFGVFNEEAEQKIIKFENLFNSLADYDMDSDEYTDCETKIELAEKEMVEILTKRLRAEPDCMYNDDDIIEYFIEYIEINDNYTNIYVDDDFIAYEIITKCYK